VGDGDAALVQIGEHRLDVAQEAAAGGGITGVADRGTAGQAGGQLGVAEGLAHQALMALGVEAVVMDAGDAAGFLTTMLQGVQTQGHDGRRFVLGRPPDAADAALQAELIILRLAPVFAVNDGIGDMVAHRQAPMTGNRVTQAVAPRT